MSKRALNIPFRRPSRPTLVKALKVTALVGVACFAFLGGLVVIPVISPAAGAQMADALRSIFGVRLVSDLESTSFQIQDMYNRTRYQVSGEKPNLSFASTPSDIEPTLPAVAMRTPLAVDTVSPSTQAIAGTTSPNKPLAQATVTLVPQPTTLPSVLIAKPYVDSGWQALGPIVGGRPVIARASLKPDPSRPYAQAAVVRIDLSEVDLHYVLGTNEPVSARGARLVPRTGYIPKSDQAPDRLLAAFNGGFKSVHGNYGVSIDGANIITPSYGLASFVIFSDGSIDLGSWGVDITNTNNIVAIRQNCPMLVDSGNINPSVNDGNRQEWGYTVKNLDTTWRSGIGITRDRRFLIYATGNSLTVQSLGEALRMAGAYNAMQLDINGFYTRFATFRPAAANSRHPVVAEKLLNEMSVAPNQFLDPYDRDFFYVTLLSNGG